MAYNKPREDTPNVPGLSTPPGESVADQLNDEQHKEGGDSMPKTEVTVDRSDSAVEFIDPIEAKQVEDPTVIFVPHKDFEARINQDNFYFRKDVPTRVSRDVANMLLEDRERGYLKDNS